MAQDANRRIGCNCKQPELTPLPSSPACASPASSPPPLPPAPQLSHIVNDTALFANDFENGQELETMGGTKITVRVVIASGGWQGSGQGGHTGRPGGSAGVLARQAGPRAVWPLTRHRPVLGSTERTPPLTAPPLPCPPPSPAPLPCR